MLRLPVPALLYRPDTHSRRQSHTCRHLAFGSAHNGWRVVLDLRTAESSYTRPPLRRMASASPMRGLAGEYAHRCDPAAHRYSVAGYFTANGVGVQQFQLFIA